MSLATQMLIAEKYGTLLDLKAIGEVLGYEQGTIENMIYADKFPIPVSKRGKSWVAHYQDVAEYVDGFRRKVA